MKNRLLLFIFFVLGLALGLGVYPHFFSSRDSILSKLLPSESRASNYKYINPLLDCELFSTEGTKELVPLKNKLDALINQEKDAGLIQTASVYFRDLNNGPWFGIRDEENFSPASLLKLPIMISLLRFAESDPNYLNRKIKYDIDLPAVTQDHRPSSKNIEKGKEYTVDELVTSMIEYSDNNATSLLMSALGLDYSNLTGELYKELGLTDTVDVNGDRPMSIKAYATLFRILFNSSYLNRSMSEKALDILSRVEYKNGLVAGVPSNIVVSHKFGERNFSDSNVKQLHDCGIVYYPQHPYLLCIMTRGNSYENLEPLITNISQQVYQSVDGLHKQNP